MFTSATAAASIPSTSTQPELETLCNTELLFSEQQANLLFQNKPTKFGENGIKLMIPRLVIWARQMLDVVPGITFENQVNFS